MSSSNLTGSEHRWIKHNIDDTKNRAISKRQYRQGDVGMVRVDKSVFPDIMYDARVDDVRSL